MQKIEQLWIFPENLSREKKNLHCWCFCSTYSAFTTISWCQGMRNAFWMKWDVECCLAGSLFVPHSLGRQWRLKGALGQEFLGNNWISLVCNPPSDTQGAGRECLQSSTRMVPAAAFQLLCIPSHPKISVPKSQGKHPCCDTPGTAKVGLLHFWISQVSFSF